MTEPTAIVRDVVTGAAAPPNLKQETVNASRLLSLDVFRGLVILAMTFVNYLAGVDAIPAWAKHRPAELEGYTLVDLVFPAFLFIAGAALPFSLRRFLSAGAPLALFARIARRVASLLMVGVIMVNSGNYSAQHTGLSKAWWYVLAYTCVIMFWSDLPGNTTLRKLFSSLRILAGLGLAVLLVLFRSKSGGWLEHSWWGILGLIGWAWLVSSLVFLACRGNTAPMIGILGLLLLLCIGDRHGLWPMLDPLRKIVGVGPVLGSTAASMLMGVIAGNLAPKNPNRILSGQYFTKLLWFALLLYVGGELVRPLHGINKNAATEAYALVSGAWSCLGFALTYWLIEVLRFRRGLRTWSELGQNALLAYLLPGLLGYFLALIGLDGVLFPFGAGWLGTANALFLTTLIFALTVVASRVGLRLKL